MSHIQVDMFEVQLGGALLLQFRTGSSTVRVLADAGVKASGYSPDHVHAKLPGAFASFGDPSRRIDLMLGTHYDEDHLVGLTPIAADPSIEIGEAWLPPVADDTAADAAGDPSAADLLVTKLAGPEGSDRLADYLRAKHTICRQAASVERAADTVRPDRPRAPRPALDLGAPRGERTPGDWAAVFRTHDRDAAITLGGEASGATHADVDYAVGPAAPADSPAGSRSPGAHAQELPPLDEPRRWPLRWAHLPEAAGADARDLATIRRAAARDAINAIALAELVDALAARGVPIRCPIIADGHPSPFQWSPTSRRFQGPDGASTVGPRLTLLGPSAGLVAKHWHRLPVGQYVGRARAERIPVRSITPSNQLSFVARLEWEGQGILVCGDAGFVDFPQGGAGYAPALLAGLLPAHVIQVAHHAGNNAHFYRALLEAGYARQPGPSLLLVSHATRDRYRPSPEFASFVEHLRPGPEGPRVLFTSKPSADRVRAVRPAVHPVVGTPHLVGDVRLTFDGAHWIVDRHSIRA
jgi:hypothetical protein